MGEYIVHAHIAGPWFVNFSDADAQTTPHPGKVWRYGARVQSAGMKNLALLAMRQLWRVAFEFKGEAGSGEYAFRFHAEAEP